MEEREAVQLAGLKGVFSGGVGGVGCVRIHSASRARCVVLLVKSREEVRAPKGTVFRVRVMISDQGS